MVIPAKRESIMKPLEQDELYQHLSGFLKNKGVELKEGGYTRAIQKSCGLLVEAINLGQKGFDRARVEIDKKLDQMRQVIHEKTAPKLSGKSSPAASANRSPHNLPPKSTRSRRPTRTRSKPRKSRS
jgi:hypothetical protein